VVEPKDLPPELQVGVNPPRASAMVQEVAAPVASQRPTAESAHVSTSPAAAPVAHQVSESFGNESREANAASTKPALVAMDVAPVIAIATPGDWLAQLQIEARELLLAGAPDVWDTLTRKFEAQLIHSALDITKGRRIEAAQKLGIGRNTITRKIQELNLD
jgi:two-component system, NtrC family, nitrogen regulation response regulator GlnG